MGMLDLLVCDLVYMVVEVGGNLVFLVMFYGM